MRIVYHETEKLILAEVEDPQAIIHTWHPIEDTDSPVERISALKLKRVETDEDRSRLHAARVPTQRIDSREIGA